MLPDLAGLIGALRGADVRFVAIGGIDAGIRAALRKGRNVTLTTPRGDLDIVQRLPGVPSFAVLDAAAWDASILGVSFRVCSRDHLIAMKRTRGSALDRADLDRLLGAGG